MLVLEYLVGLPVFLCISGTLKSTVLKYVCLIALEIGSPYVQTAKKLPFSIQ